MSVVCACSTAALAHAKEAARLLRRLTRQRGRLRSGSRVSADVEDSSSLTDSLAFDAGLALAAAHAGAGLAAEALVAYHKLVDDPRFPEV